MRRHLMITLQMRNLRFRGVQWQVAATPQLRRKASPHVSWSPWFCLLCSKASQEQETLDKLTSQPPAGELHPTCTQSWHLYNCSFLTKSGHFSWGPHSSPKLRTFYLFPLQWLNSSNHIKSCQFSVGAPVPASAPSLPPTGPPCTLLPDPVTHLLEKLIQWMYTMCQGSLGTGDTAVNKWGTCSHRVEQVGRQVIKSQINKEIHPVSRKCGEENESSRVL